VPLAGLQRLSNSTQSLKTSSPCSLPTITQIEKKKGVTYTLDIRETEGAGGGRVWNRKMMYMPAMGPRWKWWLTFHRSVSFPHCCLLTVLCLLPPASRCNQPSECLRSRGSVPLSPQHSVLPFAVSRCRFYCRFWLPLLVAVWQSKISHRKMLTVGIWFLPLTARLFWLITVHWPLFTAGPPVAATTCLQQRATHAHSMPGHANCSAAGDALLSRKWIQAWSKQPGKKDVNAKCCSNLDQTGNLFVPTAAPVDANWSNADIWKHFVRRSERRGLCPFVIRNS